MVICRNLGVVCGSLRYFNAPAKDTKTALLLAYNEDRGHDRSSNKYAMTSYHRHCDIVMAWQQR